MREEGKQTLPVSNRPHQHPTTQGRVHCPEGQVSIPIRSHCGPMSRPRSRSPLGAHWVVCNRRSSLASLAGGEPPVLSVTPAGIEPALQP